MLPPPHLLFLVLSHFRWYLCHFSATSVDIFIGRCCCCCSLPRKYLSAKSCNLTVQSTSLRMSGFWIFFISVYCWIRKYRTVIPIDFSFVLMMMSALNLETLVETILDLDLVVIATMSILLKCGFSSEELTVHTCTICMSKQLKVSGTFLYANLFQTACSLWENCLMGEKVVSVQRWITWYAISVIILF